MTKRVVNPWSKMTFSSCQILTIGYCDNFALVTSGGISEKHVLKPLYVFAVGPFIWLADPAVVRMRRYYGTMLCACSRFRVSKKRSKI